jgi:hypothetical protein
VLPRLPLVVAFVALPAFGVARAGQSLADRWGSEIGREAAAMAAHLRPVPAPAEPSPEASALDSDFAEPPIPSANDTSPALAASGQRKGGQKRKPGPPAKLGVFVSAATVLRLAQGSAMPRAVAVGPQGARPAGLRLIGVSGLGIGMRDGDVLTSVLGARVGATGEVVSRVIAARARRAREISGEFWRNGVPGSIVVEQPYLDEPAAHSASP